MNTQTDDTLLSRARLCELAEVERAKHGRWQEHGLLTKRTRYGLLDLLSAAQLDELCSALGPQMAPKVWRQVRDELGVAGKRLEVVVNLATLVAGLARTDAELSDTLPRGESAIVIELAARSARARERFTSFVRAVPSDAGNAERPAEEASGRVD